MKPRSTFSFFFISMTVFYLMRAEGSEPVESPPPAQDNPRTTTVRIRTPDIRETMIDPLNRTSYSDPRLQAFSLSYTVTKKDPAKRKKLHHDILLEKWLYENDYFVKCFWEGNIIREIYFDVHEFRPWDEEPERMVGRLLFTIHLKDAYVSSWKVSTPERQEVNRYPVEEITFTYKDIKIHWYRIWDWEVYENNVNMLDIRLPSQGLQTILH